MTQTPHPSRPLSAEDRRERLRAFADRMLIGLDKLDDPETGEDIEKGIRRALMIERLYARVDAAEGRGWRYAVETAPRRDAPKPMVSLSPVAAQMAAQTTAQTAAQTTAQTTALTQAEIAARALALKPQPGMSREQIEEMLQMLGGLMSDEEIDALLTAEDDDSS
ncbi:hypothetical protein [Asticcacaulis sp.]|uniref:hypothetical protein n=1 Tax=Asticcacaulis sp. TaxID=1872648 RepID=UPI002618C7C4|nr:hypothetical protein [Asticcacaulis sp.]